MRLSACFLIVAMALLGRPALAQGDASAGYARIKPSLVKVWALDQSGGPIESGTGFVIASDATGSFVLTAAHVVAHADSLIVNVPGQARDLAARVQTLGPVDTALLRVSEANLPAVTFTSPERNLREGSYVAAAGFLKNDDMIEISGLAPRVLYPGTISALPSGGRFIDIANLNIEEGLSGGPVFDPQTGEVIAMVDTRADGDENGGYAISAPAVLSRFLDTQGVQVAYADTLPAPPAARNFFSQPSLEPAEPEPMSEPPPQAAPPQAAPQQWQPAWQQPQYGGFGPVLIGRGIGVALVQAARGVWVRQVAPFGAARRAGISGGDLVVAVNGEAIVSAAQVRQIFASTPPGTPLMVSVERQGVVRLASLMVPWPPGGWQQYRR